MPRKTWKLPPGFRATFSHRNITTFFAPGSIQRVLWHDEIGDALMRCDWFLLLLSPAAVNSKWVYRELMFALDEERLRERIIPLVWMPCDYDRLSWALRGYQRVDLQTDFELGAEDLLRRLGQPLGA